MAMEAYANFVAIVMPRKLEIYAFEDSADAPFPHLVHEIDLPHPSAFATLLFDDGFDQLTLSPHIVMRLLLTKWDEVRVYEAVLPCQDEELGHEASEEAEHSEGVFISSSMLDAPD